MLNTGGGVYNYALNKQKDMDDIDLAKIAHVWYGKNLLGKIGMVFHPNIFKNHELEAMAAADIIESRYNPEGKMAKTICWKMDSYRAKDSP